MRTLRSGIPLGLLFLTVPLAAADSPIAKLRNALKNDTDQPVDLGEAAYASKPLSESEANTAKSLLWSHHERVLRQNRQREMRERKVVHDGYEMPFFYSITGKAPKSGRSLYISMHGGGGAPKRVNDQQWQNQKRLYRVPEGVYLAPRAPTDTWNLWHQPHIDILFDRLIDNLIVFEGVDPNRVYLMGYSAGGDGVYQLAPRMADRFAAASMMAGHPNDASPVNLRNLPFSIHVGERDAAYKRNQIAKEWGDKLDRLQKTDPRGYPHWTKIYSGKGHWMDREDAAAIPWMAKATRDPFPKTVVWEVGPHPQFYWLAAESSGNGAKLKAVRDGQTITVETEQIDRLTIFLNDAMVDLDQPVIVIVNGKERHRGVVPRTIETLNETLRQRGDPEFTFPSKITIDLMTEEG